MSDLGAALLAEVIAHPEEAAPRLVYADWLEENGRDPERAEAVRLWVRRRSLDDLDPEAWVLDTRLARIRDRHQERWKAELPELEGVQWGGFEGGFASSASVDSADVLRRHEDVIFSAAPVTELGVCVEDLHDLHRQHLEAPGLIAACPYLTRLRRLRIGGRARPEVVGLPILASSPNLARLRELDLSQSGHEDPLLETIAECPAWPSLEVLDLSRNDFSPRGSRALTRTPLLGSLRELVLNQVLQGSDAGLRALLRSPHLTGLRRLVLSECGLSRSIKALAEYPWQRLEVLNLADNVLTATAVRHLARSPHLVHLRSLDLGGNLHLGDGGVVALVRSPHLSALRVLDLGYCRLSQRGLATLAGARWLPNLTRLGLIGFEAGSSGLDILARAPLNGLRWLDLWQSGLTAPDLRALLRAPWLANLTHLELPNNSLGLEGARALAESPALENLVSLDVCTNQIPPDGADLLRARFGDRVELKRPWEL